MAKSIEARVQDSFREASREDIFRYLDWARSSILDYNQSMRRMAALLILLIAVFELVANSRGVHITVASFQVVRGSVVLILLPALIAFLFAQMITDGWKADRLVAIYRQVFKLWSGKAVDNDIDYEVLSNVTLYWSPTTLGREENLGKAASLANQSALRFTWVIILGMLAFEAHAYFVVFSTRAPSLVLWLISLGFTLTCLYLAFSILAGDSMPEKR